MGAGETDNNNHKSLNLDKSSLNTSIMIEVTDTQPSMELTSITGLYIPAPLINPIDKTGLIPAS